MPWIKLQRANDRGVEYFAIEPLAADTLAADKPRGLNPAAGEVIQVRISGETHAAVVAHSHRSAPEPYVFPVLMMKGSSGLLVQFDSVDIDEEWARSNGAR